MNNIDETIALAADTEASSRIVAMMNEQPFQEGAEDRYHVIAKMICQQWPEAASDRYTNIIHLEQAIKDKENDLFNSAFRGA